MEKGVCGGVEGLIVAEYYASGDAAFGEVPFFPSLGTLTLCVLILKNGFTVVGESNCVDPADYDVQLGRRIAREKAVQKIWALHGYLLKENHYQLQREMAQLEKQQG